MINELETVECVKCQGSESKTLYNIDKYNIVQCTNCRLTYTNPRLKRDLSVEIYGPSYFKSENSISSGYDDYLRERPMIEATFKKRISFIFDKMPLLGKGVGYSHLDIGCAMGFLVDIFQKMKWNSEGVELSNYAASFGKNELGLNIRLGTLDGLSFADESYDLITSWDVIEHSYNPIEDIRKMYKLLKKGGCLSIITPNRDSIHARLARKRWVEYQKPDEHLYFFGKSVLSEALEESGFKVVAETTAGKYVSIDFALTRLGSYSSLFNKLKELLGNRFAKNYLYINPFDKMSLLAIKT